MTIIEWNSQSDGRYVSGVSRGVFYDDSGNGHPWDGLISVTGKPQTVEPTRIYDSLGRKYDLHGNISEKRHTIVCYTYPDLMDEYVGMEYLDELGCIVDERPPRKFNMSYRTEHDGYYVIHVLIGVIASFGELPYNTDSNAVNISNITMDVEGTVNDVYGSSHLMFDSRNPITKSVENILYGTNHSDPSFNAFLNSSIIWVTRAINYAPTLEPDYANRVWVGLPDDLIGYDELYDAPVWTKDTVEIFDNLPPDGGRSWAVDETVSEVTPYPSARKKVVNGLPYRLSMWVKADVYGSKLYIELLDQDGQHAVKTGGLVSGIKYIVGGLTMPTTWTKYESVVTLNNSAAEVGVGRIYWNHPSGSVNTKQYVSGLTLTPAYDLYTNTTSGNYHPNNPPGVLNSSKWNQDNVIVYWDEVNEKAAIHSKSEEEWIQSRVSIPLDASVPVDLLSYADIDFGGYIEDVSSVNENLIRYYTSSFSNEFTPKNTHERLVKDGYGLARLFGDLPQEDGTIVTISFKLNVPDGRTYIRLFNSGDMVRLIDIPVNDSGYYAATFPWKVGGTTNKFITIYSAANSNEYDLNPGTSMLYWVKMEYGSTSTRYSPHKDNALDRRIIGTRDPQTLSVQAKPIIGPQTIKLESTITGGAHLDIYHNGKSNDDDILIDKLMVTLQNYKGDFFDGNTVPKTRGERYTKIDSTAGHYTIYEQLIMVPKSELELRVVGSELYYLNAPETILQDDDNTFTITSPNVITGPDDTFQVNSESII